MDLAFLESFYREQLLDDCVPFWFPRAVDREHGGFLTCFDRDGTLVDTDKSVWAQGRTSWMLAALYLDVEPRAEWLELAKAGLGFLEQHCVDPSDGRMYFHVARDGTPLRKRRYAYSESFACIAHAAYAAAAGSDRSAARARELFAHFTDWNFTPGRMPPKGTEHRPLLSLGPRMIALATAQELERRLGPDADTRTWSDRCVDEITRWFLRPDLRAVLEHVAPDGSVSDHFEGRTLNPGHAIECAWFLMEEGRRRGDSALVRLGCDALDWSWERGWDAEHGGLYSLRDVYGRPVQEYWHDMKFWWPHDEALIATLLAFRLTGEPRYADLHERVRAWAFTHFGDAEHGEWYGYLNRRGEPSSTLKGGLWKSFFHHPRSLATCLRLAGEGLG